MVTVDSSLAGVVVAETRIAWVDPVRGAFVHGYSLSDLADHHSYESIAHLVLTGELPTAAESPAWLALVRGATLDSERTELARHLGRTLGAEAGLAAAMPLVDAGDDAAPGALLGRFPAVCAAVRGDSGPIPGGSYATRALHALGAAPQHASDPPSLRALEILLALEAEHGLSASTFACRVAASAGGGPGLALAAATSTLAGPRHGGATAEARALLQAVAASSDPEALVAERRAKKQMFPGFGHRIYKSKDPRLPPLRHATLQMKTAPLRDAAMALESAVTKVFAPKTLHANIDLWGAVLLDALGVPPNMYVAAFALGVGCGWLSHYAEQVGTGRLIRPESQYAGVSERPVPRSNP